MDSKDPIKEAFTKAKQDIQSLKDQFSILSSDIVNLKRTLDEINSSLVNRQTNRQTDQHINSPYLQHESSDSNTPTDNWPYKALKPHIYHISSGNGGVPTDRQTDQQTDRPTHNSSSISDIERVTEILESLDTIKKDLRTRFKHLTKQEMLVFSTIYQLQEENFVVDYSIISRKLKLSESSIRDYIQKIIKKGIPIQKSKENNKRVILSLPEEFKKMASLDTILKLREL